MLEAISIAFLLLAVYSSSGTQEETFGQEEVGEDDPRKAKEPPEERPAQEKG